MTRTTTPALVVLAALLWVAPSHAAQAAAPAEVTLEECVARAVERNERIKAAQADLDYYQAHALYSLAVTERVSKNPAGSPDPLRRATAGPWWFATHTRDGLDRCLGHPRAPCQQSASK